jgi:hypothetical protein
LPFDRHTWEKLFMEMRILVAAALGALTVLAGAWFIVRSIRERRKFRLRQQGRGKSANVAPAE